MSSKTKTIHSAQLHWQNNEPVSTHFDDVYFSKAGGVAETEYVFLKHNHLIKRWQLLPSDSDFCIAETGFGTGLNFLCAATAWLKHNSKSRLHFLSFEKYPLTPQDLSTALSAFPEFQNLSHELLNQYPLLTAGYHRLSLADDRILLTLVIGDVNDQLPKTHAHVDAWFLDGFAPAKNPDMWTNTLFKHMARLSHAETTFATFTAAGIVKRGLQAAGFNVTKHKGFGHKRDMLAGQYVGGSTPFHFKDKPWFRYIPANSTSDNKSCLVIGGGLAGCQSAYALAKRGYKVTLLERHHALAQAASGNRSGVIYGKFSPHDSAQYRFYQHAYLHTLQLIRNVMGDADHQRWSDCGVLQLAYDESEAQLHNALTTQNQWPLQLLHALTAEQASKLAGCAIHNSALFFPQGGWVNPAALCTALVQRDNITIKTHTEALRLEQQASHWRVHCGNTQWNADKLVIANAVDAMNFEPTATLPLRTIRGQVTHIQPKQPHILNTVICHKGYINPAINGIHSMGATFNLKDDETVLRDNDHQLNQKTLATFLPELNEQLNWQAHTTAEGRVGFRCQTPDYLPIVGPVADLEAYQQRFQSLLFGMKHGELLAGSYHDNLFINVAHGSRGITNTGLSAEILASYINNEPAPVDQDVLNALHPARFIVRDMKRRKTTQ